MPFEPIAAEMYRDYNSETRKLRLQSEMDCLELTSFMRVKQHIDFNIGLRRLVDHVSAHTLQLPTGIGGDCRSESCHSVLA